jgi:hypothetical protein
MWLLAVSIGRYGGSVRSMSSVFADNPLAGRFVREVGPPPVRAAAGSPTAFSRAGLLVIGSRAAGSETAD